MTTAVRGLILTTTADAVSARNLLTGDPGCAGTGVCRSRAAGQRAPERNFTLEHLLLKFLRNGVAMRRLGHRLAERRACAIESCVELTLHPHVDLAILGTA